MGHWLAKIQDTAYWMDVARDLLSSDNQDKTLVNDCVYNLTLLIADAEEEIEEYELNIEEMEMESRAIRDRKAELVDAELMDYDWYKEEIEIID